MGQEEGLKISVVVPAYNEAAVLPDLLHALSTQSDPDFELIVGDDCSTDNTAEIAATLGKVVRTPRNGGPALARNTAAEVSAADILAFTDADCVPDCNWIVRIRQRFASDAGLQCLMGQVVVPSRGFWIDCMSAIGFPAGGHLGFDRVWRVSPEGFTDHISSGNFAVRRGLFEECGGFDDSFAFNCEDADLSQRLKEQGIPVKYCPDIIVSHPPWEGFRDFIRDNIRRGEGNYALKSRIGKRVWALVRLRLWSAKNMVVKFWRTPKLPFALFFLGTAFVLQQYGYSRARRRSAHAIRRASALSA